MDDRTLRRARKVLSDPLRLHAYQAALEQVCAGKVVCEIGVGVGALAFVALYHAGLAATGMVAIELYTVALLGDRQRSLVVGVVTTIVVIA